MNAHAVSAVLTWNMSGHGPISMDMAAIKALAIASGFVAQSSSPNGQHRPRADLQRMFAHYGVSSVTAFKHLFYATRLVPPGDLVVTPPRPPLHPSHEPTWRWLQRPHYLYSGQLLYGLPNGLGWLCMRTPTGVKQHWGAFAHGQPEGLGEHINQRGDKINGIFNRGEACGPGVLEYGGGSLRSNHVGARRLRFEGMLRNGAPGGRGVFVWASHGAKGKHTASNTVTLEYGEFADQQAVCCLHEAACATMVALARACATAARKARRDVRQSLSTHGLSDIVSQMPSLGPFGAPRLPTPTLDAMCGAAAQAAATGARRGQGKRLMT